jgi:hypothetical protein
VGEGKLTSKVWCKRFRETKGESRRGKAKEVTANLVLQSKINSSRVDFIGPL